MIELAYLSTDDPFELSGWDRIVVLSMPDGPPAFVDINNVPDNVLTYLLLCCVPEGSA